MIRVTQVFRKGNPAFFSIEKVFGLIKPALENKIRLDSITLPYYSNGLMSIFRNLYFVYRKRSKNIFHITGDVHYAVMALPASRTILTIHDCVFLHTTTGIKRKILKWLFLDMPVRHAALVTTVSEFTKHEIIRFTHCAADKITVISNPVNEGIRFEEKVFNTALPVIFFIGTTPNKNLERVIPALEDIRCHLRILGKLTAAHEQLLLKHHINFSVLTDICEEELAAAYVQTDIVLFPSTFEGFGLPVLEAQKAGRVIITSNMDPMKTVAGGGAFLVDPYDTEDIRKGIKKIISDAGARNDCIRKGFLNIHNYNVSAIAAAYRQLYEKINKN